MCLEGIADMSDTPVISGDVSEPTILDTLERCMQQARVLETQGRELYEMMMKTVFRVRGQQETRNGNDTTDSH